MAELIINCWLQNVKYLKKNRNMLEWNVDVLEMKRTAKDINVDLNIFNSVQINPDDALSPCMLFISRYLGKRLSQKSQHTLFWAKYNLSRHVTIWWPADRLGPIWADICIGDTAA